GARVPPAIAHAFLANQRLRLGQALERSQALDMPPACAPVVAHPINIERERRGRIRVDVKADSLSSAHTGPRTITLNPRAPVLCLGVNPRIGQQPVARARFCVLAANRVGAADGELFLDPERGMGLTMRATSHGCNGAKANHV